MLVRVAKKSASSSSLRFPPSESPHSPTRWYAVLNPLPTMPFAIATLATARVVSSPRGVKSSVPRSSTARSPVFCGCPTRGSSIISRGGSVVANGLNTDKAYNCVVTEDGVIISNDFPSGTYAVSAWWAGMGSSDEDEQPLAPRCDSERQRGCEVRCEMTADGELVCEGLSSGTYTVVNALESGADCEVKSTGFECKTSWDEDEKKPKPVKQDVGDLVLNESEGDHGIRLGG